MVHPGVDRLPWLSDLGDTDFVLVGSYVGVYIYIIACEP